MPAKPLRDLQDDSGFAALRRFCLLDRGSGELAFAKPCAVGLCCFLAGYFWSSAATKFDGGPFSLSVGAYAQIFPRSFEALGYDASLLSAPYHLVALAGAWAEVMLPLLLVLGLFTRLAAVGMIGFITVQSLTDIYGHMLDAQSGGAVV